jgi:hypothetical protein
MVRVVVLDRVHKHYVVLNCPQDVLYVITEPMPCKLIKTSIEVKLEVGGLTAFLMQLFHIKPTVHFYREPGFYDFFWDGKELLLHGVIETKEGMITVRPDIVYKDIVEYKEVNKFIQDTYDRFVNTLNNAINLASVVATAPLRYINNLIDSMHGSVAMVQELGRHNVKIVELTNTALSGANMSLDEVIRAVNEIMTKARWLLSPPPPTQAFQAPPVPMPQQPTQQQGQQQGGA